MSATTLAASVHATPLLHSPERAAERLEVGRTTIYELIASGDLESVKVGRLRRIPEAALVEYVEKLRGASKAVA